MFALSGKREKIDEKQARELLAPIQAAIDAKSFASFKELKFGGKSFNLKAAKVLTSMLPHLQGVEILDISDTLSGQETQEARQVLKEVSIASKDMDVRRLRLNELALGANGIAACEEMLKGNKNVVELSFNDCGLESKAAELITKFILSNGKPSKIEKFHIFNNCLTSAGVINLCPLFENSPGLKDIRVSTTRISSDGGLKLALAMRSCRKLQTVDFSDNQFGEDAGKIFQQEVFDNQPELKNLNLSDCGLGESVCIGIIKNLTEHKTNLETLQLTHNDITEDNAQSLADYVSQATSLRCLNLEGNDLMSNGAKVVFEALADSKNPIEDVNMLNNSLTAAAVPSILKFLRAKAGTIKKLNLNANMISAKGVSLIKDTLNKTNNNPDECLDTMSDNDDEEEEGNEVLEGLDTDGEVGDLAEQLQKLTT